MKNYIKLNLLYQQVQRDFNSLDRTVLSCGENEGVVSDFHAIMIFSGSKHLLEKVENLLSYKEDLTEEAIDFLQFVKRYCEAYLELFHEVAE